MGAEKSRSSTIEAGKLQNGRMERGINKGKYYLHVGSINNNKNQSSRTSAFSNLLHPHHSKASEAKPVSTPFLGNQVYFSSQHHYYINQELKEGTIPSPQSKNTSGRLPLIKYLCLFKTHLLTQQCKLDGLHDQPRVKI